MQVLHWRALHSAFTCSHLSQSFSMASHRGCHASGGERVMDAGQALCHHAERLWFHPLKTHTQEKRMPSSHTSSPHPWRRTRWVLVLLGVALPYAAQWASGNGLQGYIDSGWQGNLFLLALGAVLWLPLLGLTWLYRFPSSIWWPAVLGLGFAFWAHASVDLSADAQAGLAVVLVPVLSLVPAAIGAVIGWAIDVRAKRKAAFSGE